MDKKEMAEVFERFLNETGITIVLKNLSKNKGITWLSS